MDDLISRQAAIDAIYEYEFPNWCDKDVVSTILNDLPSAQLETTRRIVGKSKGGITLWYECSECGEPVDAGDRFCRSCGRRFV